MRKAQRKTIRLKYYDYAQNGLYFVTICVQGRLSLFGGVLDNAMYLNDAGKMVEKQYKELENYFNNVTCLEYIIMPNHIHFIIQILNVNVIQQSLFDIIQRFKSITTVEYIKNVRHNNWKPFHKKLWQRSYYEHIIRNEEDYLSIVKYIENN
ncbi:TPA: transposase, partial [Mannheimia haemolytica]